ncbi:MAG: hypothetical protein KatS3mg016_1852 [Fimbriimonadales bacterium]|nr:MAG: hypothetical protein KatS3mg016_1852 [Fimbriimonadales bacterium]
MNHSLDGALGVLFLYLALAGVGIVDVALFRGLTADYLTLFQRNERGVLVRGVLTVLGAVVLVVLLNAVAQSSPPDVPARGVIPLLVALVLLLLALALLLGYGALAWRLGERVLINFGVAEPNPGWCVLVATLLILSVVWIPVFGWALGLYWVVLAVGAVMQRLMSSPELTQELPREPDE